MIVNQIQNKDNFEMFVLVNASTTPQKNINNDNENVWNDKNEEKDEDSEKQR